MLKKIFEASTVGWGFRVFYDTGRKTEKISTDFKDRHALHSLPQRLAKAYYSQWCQSQHQIWQVCLFSVYMYMFKHISQFCPHMSLEITQCAVRESLTCHPMTPNTYLTLLILLKFLLLVACKMTLLLGPSGAGKTTFLLVFPGKLDKALKVEFLFSLMPLRGSFPWILC